MKLDYKKFARVLYILSAAFYFFSLFCNIKNQIETAFLLFFAGSLSLCASAVFNKKHEKNI